MVHSCQHKIPQVFRHSEEKKNCYVFWMKIKQTANVPTKQGQLVFEELIAWVIDWLIDWYFFPSSTWGISQIPAMQNIQITEEIISWLNGLKQNIYY